MQASTSSLANSRQPTTDVRTNKHVNFEVPNYWQKSKDQFSFEKVLSNAFAAIFAFMLGFKLLLMPHQQIPIQAANQGPPQNDAQGVAGDNCDENICEPSPPSTDPHHSNCLKRPAVVPKGENEDSELLLTPQIHRNENHRPGQKGNLECCCIIRENNDRPASSQSHQRQHPANIDAPAQRAKTPLVVLSVLSSNGGCPGTPHTADPSLPCSHNSELSACEMNNVELFSSSALADVHADWEKSIPKNIPILDRILSNEGNELLKTQNQSVDLISSVQNNFFDNLENLHENDSFSSEDFVLGPIYLETINEEDTDGLASYAKIDSRQTSSNFSSTFSDSIDCLKDRSNSDSSKASPFSILSLEMEKATNFDPHETTEKSANETVDQARQFEKQNAKFNAKPPENLLYSSSESPSTSGTLVEQREVEKTKKFPGFSQLSKTFSEESEVSKRGVETSFDGQISSNVDKSGSGCDATRSTFPSTVAILPVDSCAFGRKNYSPPSTTANQCIKSFVESLANTDDLKCPTFPQQQNFALSTEQKKVFTSCSEKFDCCMVENGAAAVMLKKADSSTQQMDGQFFSHPAHLQKTGPSEFAAAVDAKKVCSPEESSHLGRFTSRLDLVVLDGRLVPKHERTGAAVEDSDDSNQQTNFSMTSYDLRKAHRRFERYRSIYKDAPKSGVEEFNESRTNLNLTVSGWNTSLNTSSSSSSVTSATMNSFVDDVCKKLRQRRLGHNSFGRNTSSEVIFEATLKTDKLKPESGVFKQAQGTGSSATLRPSDWASSSAQNCRTKAGQEHRTDRATASTNKSAVSVTKATTKITQSTGTHSPPHRGRSDASPDSTKPQGGRPAVSANCSDKSAGKRDFNPAVDEIVKNPAEAVFVDSTTKSKNFNKNTSSSFGLKTPDVDKQIFGAGGGSSSKFGGKVKVQKLLLSEIRQKNPNPDSGGRLTDLYSDWSFSCGSDYDMPVSDPRRAGVVTYPENVIVDDDVMDVNLSYVEDDDECDDDSELVMATATSKAVVNDPAGRHSNTSLIAAASARAIARNPYVALARATADAASRVSRVVDRAVGQQGAQRDQVSLVVSSTLCSGGRRQLHKALEDHNNIFSADDDSLSMDSRRVGNISRSSATNDKRQKIENSIENAQNFSNFEKCGKSNEHPRHKSPKSNENHDKNMHAHDEYSMTKIEGNSYSTDTPDYMIHSSEKNYKNDCGSTVGPQHAGSERLIRLMNATNSASLNEPKSRKPILTEQNVSVWSRMPENMTDSQQNLMRWKTSVDLMDHQELQALMERENAATNRATSTSEEIAAKAEYVKHLRDHYLKSMEELNEQTKEARRNKFRAKIDKAKKEYLDSKANASDLYKKVDDFEKKFNVSIGQFRTPEAPRGPYLEYLGKNGSLHSLKMPDPIYHEPARSAYDREYELIVRQAEQLWAPYKRRSASSLGQDGFYEKGRSTGNLIANFDKSAQPQEQHLKQETDMDEVFHYDRDSRCRVKNLAQLKKKVKGQTDSFSLSDLESRLRARSVDYLSDQKAREAVEPPENQLKKIMGDSESQNSRKISENELRFMKSTERIQTPAWYANSTDFHHFNLGNGTGKSSPVFVDDRSRASPDSLAHERPHSSHTQNFYTQTISPEAFQERPKVKPSEQTRYVSPWTYGGKIAPPPGQNAPRINAASSLNPRTSMNLQKYDEKHEKTSNNYPKPVLGRYLMEERIQTETTTTSRKEQMFSKQMSRKENEKFSSEKFDPTPSIPTTFFDKYKEEIEEMRKSRSNLTTENSNQIPVATVRPSSYVVSHHDKSRPPSGHINGFLEMIDSVQCSRNGGMLSSDPKRIVEHPSMSHSNVLSAGRGAIGSVKSQQPVVHLEQRCEKVKPSTTNGNQGLQYSPNTSPQKSGTLGGVLSSGFRTTNPPLNNGKLNDKKTVSISDQDARINLYSRMDDSSSLAVTDANQSFESVEFRQNDVATRRLDGWTVSDVPPSWNIPGMRRSVVIEVSDQFLDAAHDAGRGANGPAGTFEEILDKLLNLPTYGQKKIIELSQSNNSLNDCTKVFEKSEKDLQCKLPKCHDFGIYTHNNALMEECRKHPEDAEELLESETLWVRCSHCSRVRHLTEARFCYVSCHYCFAYYCGRTCRKADWPQHKEQKCNFARISTLCKGVIVKTRFEPEAQWQMSRVARQGYAANGRGSVNIRFSSPLQAAKFVSEGWDALLQYKQHFLNYCTIDEMVHAKKEPNLIKLCRRYDPQQKFVLSVSVVAEIEDVPETPLMERQKALKDLNNNVDLKCNDQQLASGQQNRKFERSRSVPSSKRKEAKGPKGRGRDDGDAKCVLKAILRSVENIAPGPVYISAAQRNPPLVAAAVGLTAEGTGYSQPPAFERNSKQRSTALGIEPSIRRQQTSNCAPICFMEDESIDETEV